MISTRYQDILCSWLCTRIGYSPSADMMCIARLDECGKIMGVVGYDGFNGASVWMHCAGSGPWFTRSYLFAIFHYPFVVLGCRMVLVAIPSGNTPSLSLTSRLGYQHLITIPGAHPDGALFIKTMHRSECRYLEARYGKEVQTASSA